MLSENTVVSAARAALERTYTGVCTVIESTDITDPITKITSKRERVCAENIPCRISFENVAPAAPSDTAAAFSQTIKLFIPPETDIREGSKIIVTQNGKTAEYSCSGQPAVYPTHREVLLVTFRGWA